MKLTDEDRKLFSRMARRRWAKMSPEERSAYGKKMALAKAKLRRAAKRREKLRKGA